ncbi:MAG: glutamate-5-semialdehyde dehydrogenase [Actinobacteria bacterium]|nr:glutamate-5-semialdehyde dehydrogenase [Actinomycetota bacterium]
MPDHATGPRASVAALAQRAKSASRALATASSAQKDSALHAAADLLVARADEVLTANVEDIARAEAGGVSPTVIDRLRLDERRVQAMAGGLRQVASLPDPVGEVVDGWVRPNGLSVSRVRVPLGVVAIIYENRPNVTSDAAGLCLKAGNAAFLRGSSGAIRSNTVVAGALREACVKAGLPDDAVVLVEDTSREAAVAFMRQRGLVDCLIPRGGPSLIASILEHATVPYVIDGDGNCHVYVDAAADIDMARRIVVNAKCSRPSVCNAAETLLVHRAVADRLLPRLRDDLADVEVVGDERARSLWPGAGEATEDDWAEEFLALKLAVRVVDSLDDAVAHITRYGSGHSEAIVTESLPSAQRFCREVDAAAVLVNASTRFVDGEEFGFGAEIGISTQKLHARGPMGLRELTTAKYVVVGSGQIR